MSLGPTFVMYFLVGLAVAVAIYVVETNRRSVERFFLVTTAILFWPIYLPMLLAPKKPRQPTDTTVPRDELTEAIGQVQCELQGALRSLNGQAEAVAEEIRLLPGLQECWIKQSERIREMDRLLAQPDFAPGTSAISDPITDERLKKALNLRKQNVERLRQLRKQTREDLLARLAWVRELISMIHLAKFSGAPATRIQELPRQVAKASDRIADITLKEEPTEPAGDNT